MGCPSQCEIGENLVFTVNTHDPDTGVATDADSVPSYRVYEDETATAILTGDMAKLDDANTTGFYSELLAVTTANGFEHGKNYAIYIEATVDSDTGSISFNFKARRSTGLGSGAITFTYTLTNAVGGAPIADADVWATSDIAGNYVIASGRTDSSGEVVFYLDAGTVYIWRQKTGWDFTNPDTETVA